MDIVEFCEKFSDHPLFNFQKILLRKLYDASKNGNQLALTVGGYNSFFRKENKNGKNERSGNYAG